MRAYKTLLTLLGSTSAIIFTCFTANAQSPTGATGAGAGAPVYNRGAVGSGANTAAQPPRPGQPAGQPVGQGNPAGGAIVSPPGMVTTSTSGTTSSTSNTGFVTTTTVTTGTTSTTSSFYSALSRIRDGGGILPDGGSAPPYLGARSTIVIDPSFECKEAFGLSDCQFSA